MVCIGYNRANDIVPQSWMFDYLKMYKISDKIMKFITETIKNCKVRLMARENTLAEVKIKVKIYAFERHQLRKINKEDSKNIIHFYFTNNPT